jgi:LysR family transcriptional regulator, regulator of abg operon
VKLTQLSYVAAIAEQGSLRAAARHLGVAQPAFSRSIAELERELGAALFERHARGMIATPLGEAFVRRANSILNDVRRAKDEFEQLKGNATGEVTIGLSIAAHLRLLPGTLRPFRDRHPRVRLHIIEGFYPTLAPGLQDGSVDFYVGPDPGLRLPATLKKEILFSSERAVLCRVKHPLANSTSLKQLHDTAWVTTSITPKAENEIGDVFKRHRLPEPKLVLQSQSALTLLTCLTNSDLLAMAPSQWVNSPIAAQLLRTIPVKEELSRVAIIVVTRRDVPLVPAAGYLLDIIKRTAGHIDERSPGRIPRSK